MLFLNVQMPGLNGLQLAAKLPAEKHPALVFITAFDKFAVEAFATEAVDYLLKPFDRERLALALAKVRTVLSRHPVPPSAWLDRTAVKSIVRIDYVATAPSIGSKRREIT